MRARAAHAQATGVGGVAAAPQVRVAAPGDAGQGIRIVVVEGGIQANPPNSQLAGGGITKLKSLVEPVSVQAPGNRYLNGANLVSRP